MAFANESCSFSVIKTKIIIFNVFLPEGRVQVGHPFFVTFDNAGRHLDKDLVWM